MGLKRSRLRGPVHVETSLEAALKRFFRELGVPEREWKDRGLDIANTPHRVAKMYREELLSSYRPGALEALVEKFRCFDVAEDDALVTCGPIDMSSLCAHHALPFAGRAFVGYLPGDVLIGASKLSRVVDHFSRMLQIQERLSRQVAEFVLEHSGARLVLVMIQAQHQCMTCRGVRKQRAEMITTAIRPLEDVAGNKHIIDEFYRQVGLLAKGN